MVDDKKYDKVFLQFYDSIALRYFNYSQKIDEIENIVKPQAKVLELGVGTGNIAILLLKRGYAVDGVDFCKDMLNVYKRRCKSQRLYYKTYFGDAIDVKIKDSFDVVLSHSGALVVFDTKNGVFVDMRSKEYLDKLLRKIFGWLCDAGCFIVNIEKFDDVCFDLGNGFIYKREIIDENFPYTRKFSIIKDNNILSSYATQSCRMPISVFRDYVLSLGFDSIEVKNSFLVVRKK